MVDIHLRACTDDVNNDVLNNSWIHGKLIHIDNKAEENYNDIKNNLRNRWSGQITFKYNYNHIQSDVVDDTYPWWTYGGPYGYKHSNLKTYWPNTDIKILRYQGSEGSYRTNNTPEGVIDDFWDANVHQLYPGFAINKTTGMVKNIKLAHIIYGPMPNGIIELPNNKLKITIALFNVGITVYFSNGKQYITKTDNTGNVTIDNLGDMNDPYRAISIYSRGVLFGEKSEWIPTAIPFGQGIEYFKNRITNNYRQAAMWSGKITENKIVNGKRNLKLSTFMIGVGGDVHYEKVYGKKTLTDTWVLLGRYTHNTSNWVNDHYVSGRVQHVINNVDPNIKLLKVVWEPDRAAENNIEQLFVIGDELRDDIGQILLTPVLGTFVSWSDRHHGIQRHPAYARCTIPLYGQGGHLNRNNLNRIEIHSVYIFEGCDVYADKIVRRSDGFTITRLKNHDGDTGTLEYYRQLIKLKKLNKPIVITKANNWKYDFFKAISYRSYVDTNGGFLDSNKPVVMTSDTLIHGFKTIDGVEHVVLNFFRIYHDPSVDIKNEFHGWDPISMDHPVILLGDVKFF